MLLPSTRYSRMSNVGSSAGCWARPTRAPSRQQTTTRKRICCMGSRLTQPIDRMFPDCVHKLLSRFFPWPGMANTLRDGEKKDPPSRAGLGQLGREKPPAGFALLGLNVSQSVERHGRLTIVDRAAPLLGEVVHRLRLH